jgi:hypothetical protein
MIAALTGISLGIIIILSIHFLEQLDKTIIYGLILSAIGFLYVGFAWSDTKGLIINAVQAVLFLFLAYFGMRKNIYIMIAGYFLHGIWDLLYGLFQQSSLIPPHYDLFCLSIDFTMAFYLLIIKQQMQLKVN